MHHNFWVDLAGLLNIKCKKYDGLFGERNGARPRVNHVMDVVM